MAAMIRPERIGWLLLALGLLALAIEKMQGQTLLRPAQIRNWSQVAPPGSSGIGTRLRLDQIAIDPSFIADWAATIQQGSYDHYRIAIVSDQPNPVLIVCSRPETDPLGPGCVGGLFWFTAITK